MASKSSKHHFKVMNMIGFVLAKHQNVIHVNNSSYSGIGSPNSITNHSKAPNGIVNAVIDIDSSETGS